MDEYEEGKKAGIEGKKHWENPNVLDSGIVRDSQTWYGGWCRGKQLRNAAPEAEVLQGIHDLLHCKGIEGTDAAQCVVVAKANLQKMIEAMREQSDE